MIKIGIGDIQIGAEERSLIDNVVKSSKFSEGRMVKEFESLWAAYIGTSYCVALNSGTSALLVGLLTLLYDQRFNKVRKKSKVIT